MKNDRTDRILFSVVAGCFLGATMLAVYLASRGMYWPILLMIGWTALGAVVEHQIRGKP